MKKTTPKKTTLQAPKASLKLFETILHAHCSHPLFEYSLGTKEERPTGKGWRWKVPRPSGKDQELARAMWVRRRDDAILQKLAENPLAYTTLLQDELHKATLHPLYEYATFAVSKIISTDKYTACNYPTGYGWELNRGGMAMVADASGVIVSLRRLRGTFAPSGLNAPRRLTLKEHMANERRWEKIAKAQRTNHNTFPAFANFVEVTFDLGMGKLPPSEGFLKAITGDPGYHFPAEDEVYTCGDAIWSVAQGTLQVQFYRYPPAEPTKV